MQSEIIQTDFSHGEIDPDLHGQLSLDLYRKGVREMRNFLPRGSGGAEKRGAFLFAGRAENQDMDKPVVLKTYKRSSDVVYILEFWDLKMRVRERNTGYYVSNATGLIELDTIWGSDDLRNLKVWQSVDVLYICDGQHRPQAIRRFPIGNVWDVVDFEVRDGPYLAPLSDTELTASDFNGVAITVTASQDLFQAGHLGSEWRLSDPLQVPPGKAWAPDTDYYNDGDNAVSDNKVYYKVTAGLTQSGNNQPIHSQGDVSDGTLVWRYLHDGKGTFEITAVNSPTSVTAHVKTRLPSTDATKYWREPAFSDFRGWPRVPVIFQERFGLMGSEFQPDVVNLGVVNDYTPTGASFLPSTGFGVVQDDFAIQKPLSGEVSEILWAVADERLLLGTTAGVKSITGPSLFEAVTPSAGVAVPMPAINCSSVQGVMFDSELIYASETGKRLYALDPVERINRDLTEFAKHGCAGKVKEIAVLQDPDKFIFLLMENGELWVMIRDRMAQKKAMAPIVPAGSFRGGVARVESIAAATNETGKGVLWASILRDDRGIEERLICYMEPPWDGSSQLLDEQKYCDYGAFDTSWMDGLAASVQYDGARLTGNAGAFAGFAVGDEVWLRIHGGALDEAGNAWPVKLTVSEVVSDAELVVTAQHVVPDDYLLVPINQYGKPLVSVPGYNHLKGQSVDLLIDGVPEKGVVSDDGEITLPKIGMSVTAGLAYTARLRSLDVFVGASTGLALVKHVDEMMVTYRSTLGMRVGVFGAKADPVMVGVRQASDLQGRAVLPKTGTKMISPANRAQKALSLEAVSDMPLAAMILAVAARVTVNG